MIIELMDLDADKTIGLLLEKDRIPPEVVVEKLKNHEQLLYKVIFALLGIFVFCLLFVFISIWMRTIRKTQKARTTEN